MVTLLLCAVVRSAAFKPLADVVSTNSQPLLEEAAAIGALAQKLQPMVQRAQQLQQERGHPVSTALAGAASAAGAGVSGRRRAGGKAAGGAAADAAAGDVGKDAAGDVEQQVRQLMAETGASLQQLKQMNSTLSSAGAQ